MGGQEELPKSLDADKWRLAALLSRVAPVVVGLAGGVGEGLAESLGALLGQLSHEVSGIEGVVLRRTDAVQAGGPAPEPLAASQVMHPSVVKACGPVCVHG